MTHTDIGSSQHSISDALFVDPDLDELSCTEILSIEDLGESSPNASWKWEILRYEIPKQL